MSTDYGQSFVGPTHCFAVAEAVPVHGVCVPFEQLAETWMRWQTLSSARISSLLFPVPLTRATRASSAAPPAAKAPGDSPSMVQGHPQPVWPATDAGEVSTPLQPGLAGGVSVTVVGETFTVAVAVRVHPFLSVTVSV